MDSTLFPMNNKIHPSLWFHNQAGNLAEIISYYQRIFHDDFQASNIVPINETPSGHTELCEVAWFGQKYMLMCTELEHQPLNDAFSLILNCHDQHEIDTFWDYFTREGKASQCGWCMDKYGLRWQVLPVHLPTLMASPGAIEVMMGQTKIIIADYTK